jgi:Xaa-Pro dipeptidase
MPVGNNGHFTPTSSQIYDLVLSMQFAAFNMIKPGVHWDRVHLECHKVLVSRFLELGLFKNGSKEEILNSGVSAAFFPHGLGHSLGMDVHDAPEASRPAKNDTIPKEDIGHEKLYPALRLRLPLQVGMVVVSIIF